MLWYAIAAIGGNACCGRHANRASTAGEKRGAVLLIGTMYTQIGGFSTDIADMQMLIEYRTLNSVVVGTYLLAGYRP